MSLECSIPNLSDFRPRPQELIGSPLVAKVLDEMNNQQEATTSLAVASVNRDTRERLDQRKQSNDSNSLKLPGEVNPDTVASTSEKLEKTSPNLNKLPLGWRSRHLDHKDVNEAFVCQESSSKHSNFDSNLAPKSQQGNIFDRNEGRSSSRSTSEQL